MNWFIFVPLVVLIVLLAFALWLFLAYQKHMKKLPQPTYRKARLHPDLHAIPNDSATVVWIGHSTVFINLFGIKILTDPVFSEQVGVSIPGSGWKVGPRRHTAPAVALADLPDVDLILLSHAHLDHLDLPSLRKLAKPTTQVITATGTAGLLRRLPFAAVHEQSSTEHRILDNNVTVTAVPVRHWGRRYPWNKNYAWTGYVIEYGGVKLVFAGDTAYTTAFRELAAREKDIDLVMMPIGAYSPDSYQGSHCTPEQAWEMFEDTGAKWLVPIHYDTFVLSQEPVEEPLQRLLAAAGSEANRHRVVVQTQGGAFQLPRLGVEYEEEAHSMT